MNWPDGFWAHCIATMEHIFCPREQAWRKDNFGPKFLDPTSAAAGELAMDRASAAGSVAIHNPNAGMSLFRQVESLRGTGCGPRIYPAKP